MKDGWYFIIKKWENLVCFYEKYKSKLKVIVNLCMYMYIFGRWFFFFCFFELLFFLVEFFCKLFFFNLGGNVGFFIIGIFLFIDLEVCFILLFLLVICLFWEDIKVVFLILLVLFCFFDIVLFLDIVFFFGVFVEEEWFIFEIFIGVFLFFFFFIMLFLFLGGFWEGD